MAAIESIIVKLETPKSESDSNYEQFEYMLAWYGRDGEYLNYLFTDWEESRDPSVININVKNKDKLSNIINSEDRTIRLVAEDLTLNDFKIYSSITVAKNAIRVFKDGTTEPVGIDSNSVSWRQTDGRYNLEFDIVLYELPLAQ